MQEITSTPGSLSSKEHGETKILQPSDPVNAANLSAEKRPMLESLPQRLPECPLSRSDVVAILNRFLLKRLKQRFPDLQREDAEDIAMEAIAKTTRWPALPHAKLSALALTIAIHATYHHYRRKYPGKILSLDEQTEYGPEIGELIATFDADPDLKLTLESALQKLEPLDREIVHLRVQGYTLDEITRKLAELREGPLQDSKSSDQGQVMDISALYRRIERIRRKIAEVLSEERLG